MSRELYNLISHGPNEHELRSVEAADKKSGYSKIKANVNLYYQTHLTSVVLDWFQACSPLGMESF